MANKAQLGGIFMVTILGVTDAYGQGATDTDDHPHLLHIEVTDPDPNKVYPDGPEIKKDALEPTVDDEQQPEKKKVATFDLSGWVWFNYSIQAWQDTNTAKFANFEFNQVQLTGSASWGELSSRFEIRFFSDILILRQAWIQYAWDDNAIQVGHVFVPWGRHKFSSNSWWFTLGWYATVEDDYDYGLVYTKDNKNFRLDIGYYIQDNAGLLGEASRWDSDLTPQGEQQNREFSSFAARGVYKVDHGEALHSEFGGVGQVGLLVNDFTDDMGYRWLGQVMYNGSYHGWKPLVQLTRHEFRPDNPDQINGVAVDDRVVRISQFGAFRDIAARSFLFNVSLAKEIPFDYEYFTGLVPYIEYSLVLKDEADFADSHLIVVGCQVHMGPVWIWVDFLTGRNATFLNDSFANSALGAGAIRSDTFEHRTNIQLQYYF